MIEIVPDNQFPLEISDKTLNYDWKKNGSGYPDPTATSAIQNLDEEKRFHDLLHTIHYICRLANFEIENRIVLTDKKTGKVWK